LDDFALATMEAASPDKIYVSFGKELYPKIAY